MMRVLIECVSTPGCTFTCVKVVLPLVQLHMPGRHESLLKDSGNMG